MDIEIEKRVKKLEIITERLTRKAKKKMTSAMITPYPISNCAMGEDVHGPILKYMFSERGVIGKGLIKFDKKLKSGVIVTVTLNRDEGSQSKSFVANGNQLMVELGLEVYKWDRITVIIVPNDPEDEKLNEVWVAFSWTPYVGEATVKSFLIDQLEEGNEDA